MMADGPGQTNLADDPANDSGPAWSLDGSRIAFTSDREGNSKIYVMIADGPAAFSLSWRVTLSLHHEGRAMKARDPPYKHFLVSVY